MRNGRKRIARGLPGGLATLVIIGSGFLTACTPAPVVLSGTVTDGSGAAVRGATVRVYADDAAELEAQTVTDDDGSYRFSSDQLTDGDHRIRFGDADWFDGAGDWASSEPVAVSVADPGVVDDVYDEDAGSLAGTVTDADDAEPLSDVEVTVLDLDHREVDSTGSDYDGTWEIDGLLPGTYKVRFSSEGHATVYDGGTATEANAPGIELASGGSVQGIDATLTQGAVIHLDVDVPEGAALVAYVFDPVSHDVVAVVPLDEDHQSEDGPGYTIEGLAPGSYDLVLLDHEQVVAPWFYGQASGDALAPITLVAGDEFDVGDITFTGSDCVDLAPHADLSGRDLSRRSYLGCDLSGADLSHANLSGAILSSADLTGANLSGATIDGDTLFFDATITGVDLDGTDLTNMWNVAGLRSGGITGTPTGLGPNKTVVDGYFVSDEVDLSGAQLDGADLSGQSITDVDLDGASLSGADLRGADFSFALIRQADLSGAQLTSDGTTSTRFAYATLTGSDLSGVTVDAGTDFSHAGLASTTWTGTSLAPIDGGLGGVTTGGITHGPDSMPVGWKFAGGYFVGPGVFFNDADLSGIDLHGIDLTGTSFLYSDLSGADFSGLDLSGLAIQYCDLTEADFSDVTVSSTTKLVGDRFTGAILTGTNLSAVTASNFSSVSSGGITAGPTGLPSGWSLVGGYFIGRYADLDGADFSGVDLTGVSLADTSVQDARFATATMTNVSSSGLRGTPASLPTGWFVADSHANGERYLAGPSANLANAVFAGIDLSQADLHGANLSYAKFLYGVDITGIDLGGATLTGVTSEVTGAPSALPTDWAVRDDASGMGHLLGPTATVFGAYGSIDFTGADLSGLHLSQAVFTSTNLTDADLSGTDLSQAKFTNAIMTGTDLTSADLSWVDFTKSTGTPSGGATATYLYTKCPDSTTQTSPSTCVGHGFDS